MNTQGYTATSICWILCSQVHGASCHRVPWRNPSFWFHFHRNVSVLQCYWGTLFKMIQTAMLKCFLFLSSCDRYFIFTSFWAYKIYYVYGFMMLVLVILCIVTVCVTIVCTYFLLNAEDYRWWVFPPHGSLEYQPQNWGIVTLSSILFLVCLSLSSRQWTSFLSAASTAVYVYMYSFYYYFFKTKWVLLFINPMKHPVVEVLTSYTPLTF